MNATQKFYYDELVGRGWSAAAQSFLTKTEGMTSPDEIYAVYLWEFYNAIYGHQPPTIPAGVLNDYRGQLWGDLAVRDPATLQAANAYLTATTDMMSDQMLYDKYVTIFTQWYGGTPAPPKKGSLSWLPWVIGGTAVLGVGAILLVKRKRR